MRVGKCLNAAAISSAVLFAGAASTGAARADILAVGNGSFEMPDTLSSSPLTGTAHGGAQTGETYDSETATSGGHYAANGDAIPYWIVTTDPTDTTTGIEGGGAESYGVDNPPSSKFHGTNGPTTSTGTTDGNYSGLTYHTDYSFNTLAAQSTADGYQNADGYQFGYMNLSNKPTGGSHTATFTYDPTDAANAGANPVVSLGNFIPGDTYTLTFAVGTRLDKPAYTYSGTLLDNGVPIGTAAAGDSPAADSGQWLLATYTLVAPDSGTIGIQLNGTGFNTQVDFDNVQLTHAATAVPEPASLSLLGLGALAILARRRKV